MNEQTWQGERWLAAAAAGGLPEPWRDRWQPLRVGIVNLWEYDLAEFWFADGRLVLRGGNGAGKTKVLELTTLMLLRGEIVAPVLDPFGSQHRTMRYNLLPSGDGDDPRPSADSGLGYAWVEFGSLDRDGQPRYLTCGLGASTRRGTGTTPVTRWLLVTHLRPGQDLQFTSADGVLDAKQLRRIDGVEVLDNATSYRARLARELFDLEPDAYDNLTELLKQLRRPKLGERLNPTSLATTLREALPALATNEIDQLAKGWDQLEQLRKAVEHTKQAALLVAQFVRSGWRPWAAVVVRRRADQLTSATTELDNTTRDRREAEKQLQDARLEVSVAAAELTSNRTTHRDRSTELRELLDSQAYQDAVAAAHRVEALRGEWKSLGDQVSAAQRRAEGLLQAVTDARRHLDERQQALTSQLARTDEVTEAIRSAAVPAGLAPSVEAHLPHRDLPSLRADHATRQDRFAHLKRLHKDFDAARHRVDISGRAVELKQEAVATATRLYEEAERGVAAEVDALRHRIREWAAAAAVAAVDEGQVARWCELVVDLSTTETADTKTTLPSPRAAIRAHVDQVRTRLRERREELNTQRRPLAICLDQTKADLDAVLARTETAPAEAPGWRRRERPGDAEGAGAPLWRCVQPVPGLPADRLDLMEATLAASGLLDAWLTPDGRLAMSADGEPVDVQLHVGETARGANLRVVLEPTPAGGVSDAVVGAVLAGVGWHPTRPLTGDGPTWLTADGRWRVGPLTGCAEPTQPASYLGATAREAARQREIARLRDERDRLTDLIAELDDALAQVSDSLSTLTLEEGRIPPELPLTDALSTLRERHRHLLGSQDQVAEALAEHQRRENARDAAWGAFTEYAGTHAFPLRDLDDLAAALNTYRAALDALDGALELVRLHEEALRSAQQHLTAQNDQHTEAADLLTELTHNLASAEIRLRTAEEALGTDHQHQLRRREELDRHLRTLNDQHDKLNSRHTDAKVAAGLAKQTLDAHEQRRQQAETARDNALLAWWQTYDAGLAQLSGLPEPDRRVVETARDAARVARREITVPADAQAEERAWRRCFAQLQELRQQLLPNRDVRVDDESDETPIQRVTVLADSAAGWQPPNLAADLLATQVRDQEATFDAEQQRVLTTLLGSTFIEHLKDRLDYTARTFRDVNDQLAAHPTRQGHVVRLDWSADPADPDAGAVITALSQGYQLLSPQRQDMVRSFLARKIDAARADATADGAADWKEQLAAALDYRGWLRITLSYRPGPTGRFVPFDAAKHATKSGGEKVVLLSQPLFAAAVVAYNAADPRSPRWIWLDEAMTGVDADIKASFMGLTVEFDLDVMLTAHDEWCRYATVPAVAVYDLARQKHLPGVDAMPYLWCGGQFTQVEQHVPAPSGNGRLHEGLFALTDTE